MDQGAPKHTIWQTLALHLVPGALITAFYFALAPAVQRAGYPPLAALFLGILVIIVPVALGILLVEGRRRNGRLSLSGVVLNRERIPTWQYFVFVPVLLALAAAAFSLFTPLD